MNAQPPNPFLRLFAGGYRYLVPIVPHDAELSERSVLFRKPKARGKAPGERGHDGLWRSIKEWQTAEPDEQDLTRWALMGAGVGIRTGLQHDGTYLFGIDADTLDPAAAEIIRAQVEGRLGDLPTRIGRAPKALYLIRCDGPLPYTSLGFRDGVLEILGQGKQFVAVGIHPDTLEAYRWTRGLRALDELPTHTPQNVLGLLDHLRTLLPEAGEVYAEGGGDRSGTPQRQLVGKPEVLTEAVKLIPNVYRHPGRGDFIRMAAAFRGAFQDDYELGQELFCEWAEKADLSGRPDENAHEDPAQVYRSIRAPFSAGAPLLYELAEKADPTGRFTKAGAMAAGWFDEVAASKGVDTTEAPSTRDGARGLEWITLTDAAATALTASTKPLIKGLLDQGAMTVLYGESNTGKTFVAMDMGYHIATGRPWGGMRTTQMRVAYVAAEGGVGARKRAAALCAKYGPCDDFHYLLSPVNLLDPNADLKPLCTSLLALGPDLGIVFFDTLSRVMAGGDENSSVDMGALVRHFDVVRAVTKAHLLAVHHTGKDLAKGARGHSLLRAATDTEIEITEGRVRVTKQRDLDKEWSSQFALESMTLGVSEDGDVVTSAVVDLTRGVQLAPPDTLQAVVDAVRGRDWRRDIRAGDTWVGIPIGRALGVSPAEAAGRARITEVLELLIREGRLAEEMRKDPTTRKMRFFVSAPMSIFE